MLMIWSGFLFISALHSLNNSLTTEEAQKQVSQLTAQVCNHTHTHTHTDLWTVQFNKISYSVCTIWTSGGLLVFITFYVKIICYHQQLGSCQQLWPGGGLK